MADSRSNLVEFMQAFDRMVPVDSGINPGETSKPNQIPGWMVKILDYTESAIDKFTDYSILRGFYAKTSRGTSLSGKTNVLSSNILRQSHVVLYIPRGNLQTKLESHLYQSTPITKITIVNIAKMNGVIGTLQEIDYEQCYVQQIEPVLDWILVEFKITKYSNTLFKYDTAGRLLGKDMASMDYTLNPKIDVSIYHANSNEEENSEQEAPEEIDTNDSGTQSQSDQGNSGGDDQDDDDQDGPADDVSEDEEDGVDSPPQQENSAISAVKSLVGEDKQAVQNAVDDTLGISDAKAQAKQKLQDVLKNEISSVLSKSGVTGLGGGDSTSNASPDSSSGDIGGDAGSNSQQSSDGSLSSGGGGSNDGSASSNAASNAASNSSGGDQGESSAGSSTGGAGGGSGNDIDNSLKKSKKSLLDDIVKKADSGAGNSNNSA
ncbi:MAG: hypothetical protein ACK4V2_05570 [Pseudomonadota bacterium]